MKAFRVLPLRFLMVERKDEHVSFGYHAVQQALRKKRIKLRKDALWRHVMDSPTRLASSRISARIDVGVCRVRDCLRCRGCRQRSIHHGCSRCRSWLFCAVHNRSRSESSLHRCNSSWASTLSAFRSSSSTGLVVLFERVAQELPRLLCPGVVLSNPAERVQSCEHFSRRLF